jgi:hypothetical protein
MHLVYSNCIAPPPPPDLFSKAILKDSGCDTVPGEKGDQHSATVQFSVIGPTTKLSDGRQFVRNENRQNEKPRHGDRGEVGTI